MANQPIIVRPSRARRSVYDRTVAAPRIHITERDWLVLAELARHRFLTAEQINRLAFQTPARRVRRRLRLLFDADIIDRISVVAQPTRGIPSYLYCLTDHGARLIAAHLGEPIQAPSKCSRSLRFVVHHVTVCDFFVCLSEALALRTARRATSGLEGAYRVLKWEHEWQLKIPQAIGPARAERVTVTDPAMRSTSQLTFLPDAFFELGLPDGSSMFFFYECDLSTHPLKVWRERALLYAQYARPEAGLFRRRFGGGTRDAFRLLVVCPRDYRGRSRCNNILSTIEATVGKTTIVLGTTLPELRPPVSPSANGTGRARDQAPAASDAILKPVWRQVGSSERTTLLPPVMPVRPVV